MPNAKLNPEIGRQKALTAEIAFDFSHVQDTAVAVKALGLPYGAQVIGGAVIVDTAFNPTGTGASLVLDVGDAISPARYFNDANLTAVGRTPLNLTGYVSDGGAVLITPALVGTAATAGAARLQVTYVIKGRAEEVQPV